VQKVLKVDIGDLKDQKENLADFLRTQFSLDSSVTPKGLRIKLEKGSNHSLTKMVNKFVYRKKLNNTHWVTVENNTVKIKRFSQKKDRWSKLSKIFGFRGRGKKLSRTK